jgi:hypothetical protein
MREYLKYILLFGWMTFGVLFTAYRAYFWYINDQYPFCVVNIILSLSAIVIFVMTYNLVKREAAKKQQELEDDKNRDVQILRDILKPDCT